MNDKDVDEVLEGLANAKYLNNILSIAVVTINKKGEPEIRLAISPGYMYAVNAGYDLLKQNLISKLMSDGSKNIDDELG